MDLYFYDAIGPESLEKVLGIAGSDEDVNVHINSPGGSVYDGLAIYNFLQSSPNNINVSIDGMAGSIASVIAMAGDNIDIHEAGMLMVHNASAMMFGGNKEDLEKQIDILSKIDDVLLNIYTARTKQDKPTMKAFMEAETFFTSKEAKKLGFVTNIIKPKKIAAQLLINDKMDNVLKDIRAKFQSITGKVSTEAATKEELQAIEEAAEELALEKLEKKKADIGNTIGDDITAEMVTMVSYEAYNEKVNSFVALAMDHIEKTQIVIDGLNEDIDSRVKTAMEALLAKVTSKTQVPAANQFSNNGQDDQPETEEEYNARRQKIAAERENNRKLTT